MKKSQNRKCDFCRRTFKNEHGLHIHWHYCFVKSYFEMPRRVVNKASLEQYLCDPFFLKLGAYHPVFFDFIEKDEIGMLKGERIILK